MKEKRFKKIYVEITNICNLKCSFCPDSRREKKFMDISEFEIIIDKIKAYTNLIALHVKGEPLMHPNLKEILEICYKNNILVNITTNATLLEKNKDVLINSKSLRQINISLHSLSQNNNDIFNFNTYTQDVIRTCDEIIKNSNIIISYRLWNLDNIKNNDKNNDVLKVIGDYYKINDLTNLAKENKFIELKKNTFLNQDIEFVWPSIKNEIISDVGTCQGLRSQIAILANGDVVPCCLDQEGEINLGNIFEENLEEILDSNMSIKIKEGFENRKIIHNLCKRCGFRTKF